MPSLRKPPILMQSADMPDYQSILNVVDYPKWMADGACTSNIYVFDLEEGLRGIEKRAKIELAKKLCQTCPVLLSCKEWAKEKQEQAHKNRFRDDVSYPWTDIVVAGQYYPAYYIH